MLCGATKKFKKKKEKGREKEYMGEKKEKEIFIE